ncbi:MAG: amylosucrase, partial [Oscillospiraceae bacterium]|nr:amylosucrase [Oscillospiraceae bacterium]
DEIAQLNDYSYHDDLEKAADSRYLHRGAFRWDLAALRGDPETRQGKVFQALRRLERIRADHAVFCADATVWAFDTGDNAVLGLVRDYAGAKLTALYNFSEHSRSVPNPAMGATDLLTDTARTEARLDLPGYGFLWLLESGGPERHGK